MTERVYLETSEGARPEASEQARPESSKRAWEISTYQERDRAEILSLIRDEYGDVDRANGDYYDWLRTACPPDVQQWIVREKGTDRVISAGTMVGVRAAWRGQGIKALLGFDMIVAPEYRRQGIHTTLTRQTRADVKRAGFCVTTIFPNPKSMPQLARSQNYHLVSRVPLLIRPLDMRALMEARVGSPLLALGSQFGWEVAGRTLWRQRRPLTDGLPPRISEDTVLDEGYDSFWEQVRAKYDLMLVRDRAFLQWRFHDIPTREYQILSARSASGDSGHSAPDAKILGYIVLRQANIRGTMTGLIADFLVLPGEQGDRAGLYLLDTALERFKQAQIPLAGGILLPHTQEYALMRRAGFLSAPQPIAPQPFHLFIRSHCDDPPLSALRRPESWHVTIADHDAA
jgi:GNAT superfamily N-acetyltransferase